MLTLEFLSTKQFGGAGGLEIDDDIGLSIALQACLPVLELGLDWYDDFTGIVVYPDQFVVKRSEIDDAGVLHESEEPLAGETIPGGPVVISWADARPLDEPATWNVVIHEFVHKMDMRDGVADGIPPLPAAQRRAWTRALHEAIDAFDEALERVERSIPRHVDPESLAADAWYARLPLDPYAAHDPAEFFAVAGETFFLEPGRLRRSFPAFHRELVRFFGYDPEHPDR